MSNKLLKVLMKSALQILKLIGNCKKYGKEISLVLIGVLATAIIMIAGTSLKGCANTQPSETDISESSSVVEVEPETEMSVESIVEPEPEKDQETKTEDAEKQPEQVAEPSEDPEKPTDQTLDTENENESRSDNYTSINDAETDPMQNVDNKKTTYLDMCVAIEDAKALKKYGIETVCLRGTRRNGELDNSFASNYKQLVKAGIGVHVYKYSYAETEKEIKAEAENLIKKIKKYDKIDTIWLDVETDFYVHCSQKTMQKMCNTFGEACSKNGYKWGVYCSASLYTYKDHFVGFNRDIPFWIADWSSETSEVQDKIKHKVVIHQFAAGEKTKIKISGVAIGTADLNVVASESMEVSTSAVGDGEYATELDRRHAGVFTLNSKISRIALYGTTNTNDKSTKIGIIRKGTHIVCWGWIGHDQNNKLMYYVEYFDTESGTRCEGFAYPNKMKLISPIDNVAR